MTHFTQKINSHRAQIGTFGYYIVSTLLFQCFLENDHHGNTHPCPKSFQWGQEKLAAILTGMVWAGCFLISLRQQSSTPSGMCFTPRPNPEQTKTKTSTGLQFRTFLTCCRAYKQRAIQLDWGEQIPLSGGYKTLSMDSKRNVLQH